MAQNTLPELIARIGYAARGVVYLVVGSFAVLAAMGSGGRATDGKGALHAILAAPFGKVLLGIVALGLLGFAVWRVLQAAFDADRLGREPKALLRRIIYAGSAAVHVGLAYSATRLILGLGESRNDNRAAQDWTAMLLAEPFGRWLVAGVGAAVAAGGVAMAVRGWGGDVERRLSLDSQTRNWVVPFGRFGLMARGAVFVLAGWFLMSAALHADAGEARGLGGALRSLQQQPYGWALLGITALGLFAFGAFQLASAVYRRIDAELPSGPAVSFGKTSSAASGR
ncbi:MAG TPA: DUF1206 domain-containing protein [Xanthobacteraceae bacterium]